MRHSDCDSALENRDTVFCQMRRAMDLIHYVVKDGVLDNTTVNKNGTTLKVSHAKVFPAGSNLRFHPRQVHGSRLLQTYCN